MDNIRTGNLIKEARKGKGMTQKDLADILHITDRAVSKWERGLNAPDISLLQPLSKALGVSLSRLVSGVEEDEPDIESTMKNIVVYSENQIERKTEEKTNKAAIVYYAVAIVGLIVVDVLMGDMLQKLGQYAGYEIIIQGGFAWTSRVVGVVLIATAPLWGCAALICWAMMDRKNIFVRILLISLHVLAVSVILNLSYATIKDGIQLKERHSHLITLGKERYEMIETDHVPMWYDWDTGRYKDCIVYIYDRENPDEKVEEYIQGVVSRQPLKVYRLEKQKADRTIWENHIQTLPAVMIVREGSVNVLEGYDRIVQLESKIHTYKQYNIYFY